MRLVFGTFATVRAMEAIFNSGKAKKYKPESRVLSCFVGLALLVSGLFVYGFTALRTHFIVVSSTYFFYPTLSLDLHFRPMLNQSSLCLASQSSLLVG